MNLETLALKQLTLLSRGTLTSDPGKKLCVSDSVITWTRFQSPVFSHVRARTVMYFCHMNDLRGLKGTFVAITTHVLNSLSTFIVCTCNVSVVPCPFLWRLINTCLYLTVTFLYAMGNI